MKLFALSHFLYLLSPTNNVLLHSIKHCLLFLMLDFSPPVTRSNSHAENIYMSTGRFRTRGLSDPYLTQIAHCLVISTTESIKLGWLGKDTHTYARPVLDSLLDSNSSRRREAFRQYTSHAPPHCASATPWNKRTWQNSLNLKKS